MLGVEGRQAVGRLVRVITSLDEQNAYFYIPDDPMLVRHALEIKHEREHHLRGKIDRILDDAKRELAGRDPGAQQQLYAAIHADAEEAGAVFNSELIEIDELGRAREVAFRAGLRPKTNENLYPIVAVLRAASLNSPQGTRTASLATFPTADLGHPPVADRKHQLRRLNNKSVGQLAVLSGVDHKTLQWQMNQAVAIKSVNEATESQLIRRLELIRKRIEEAAP
jgi:hypothetical protein